MLTGLWAWFWGADKPYNTRPAARRTTAAGRITETEEENTGLFPGTPEITIGKHGLRHAAALEHPPRFNSEALCPDLRRIRPPDEMMGFTPPTDRSLSRFFAPSARKTLRPWPAGPIPNPVGPPESRLVEVGTPGAPTLSKTRRRRYFSDLFPSDPTTVCATSDYRASAMPESPKITPPLPASTPRLYVGCCKVRCYNAVPHTSHHWQARPDGPGACGSNGPTGPQRPVPPNHLRPSGRAGANGSPVTLRRPTVLSPSKRLH
jgi:hypothetical protein